MQTKVNKSFRRSLNAGQESGQPGFPSPRGPDHRSGCISTADMEAVATALWASCYALSAQRPSPASARASTVPCRQGMTNAFSRIVRIAGGPVQEPAGSGRAGRSPTGGEAREAPGGPGCSRSRTRLPGASSLRGPVSRRSEPGAADQSPDFTGSSLMLKCRRIGDWPVTR